MIVIHGKRLLIELNQAGDTQKTITHGYAVFSSL
jgi:hypothetical protein